MLSVNNEEGLPLVEKRAPVLYTRRWVMLGLFVLVSTTQCTVWMTYGVVPQTSMQVYKISPKIISLLAAFGSIAFFPTIVHSGWAIEALGLRLSVLISAVLVAAGAVIRSFAFNEKYFFLVYIGQFLSAAAGPLVTIICPSLSAAWFGAEERTVATGISATANSVGVPLSFLLGLLVHNRTTFFYMIWGEGIVCAVLALLVIFFYQDKPPTPPSHSEEMKLKTPAPKPTVLDFVKDAWKVCSNINCANIVFTMMITSGSFSGWESIMVIIMQPLNYNQKQAQWAGFISSTIALFGGVVIGKVHDRFHNGKFLLILLYVLSVFSFVIFTMVTSNFLVLKFVTPFWIVIILITVGTTALYAAFPLGYEMLAELTYPMSEAVSAGVLSFMVNVITTIYLIFGDYVPLVWNSYIVTGTCFVAVLVTIFLKPKYTRMQLDSVQKNVS
eukprot:Phypoly_transcript_08941.p1 GENE.Phypoly_transcript_08941~~Phypoly_transcript_08941.p1  ORF type:complete len:442 (+),score=41.21 Phypoly_transcript_08941:115-1440(+)